MTIAASVAGILLSACHTTAINPTDDNGQNIIGKQSEKFHTGDNRSLIVFYNTASGKTRLLRSAQKYNSSVLYNYQNFNAVVLTIPDGVTPGEAVEYYKGIKGVLGVNLNECMQLD